MFKNILTFAILFLSVTFLGNSAASTKQKMLQDISFNSSEKAEDQITFRLNGPYIPKIFAIQGERPRVVFDFKDTKPARILKNTINTNGKFVQRIRMGIHYKPVAKTRIVFDLLKDEKIDFKQQFDKQNNILTISVFSAEKKAVPPPVIKEDKKKSPPALSQKKDKKKVSQKITHKTAQPAKPVESVNEANKEKQPPVVSSPKKAPEPAPKSATPQPAIKAGLKDKPAPAPKQQLQPKEKQITAPAKAAPKEELQTKKKSDTKEVVNKPTVKKNVTLAPPEAKQTQAQTKVIPVLQSVSFDKKSNQGEMVLFRMNSFQAPIVFGVEEGKPRIVCDFKETDAGKNLQAKMDVQGKYIHSIRINKETKPKNVRVILDLAANKNYDLQQVFFKKENLFVLIVNTQEKASTKVPLQIPSQ